MLPEIPTAWRTALGPITGTLDYRALETFLDAENAAGRQILPPRENIFNAFHFTMPETVRVVLLGQDPYPTPGHAHGLCFSVRPDVRPIPRSLANIYKELRTDLGAGKFEIPPHGCLESWARQGVLMLNTVLTVRAGEANSHQKCGWEFFTDHVLTVVNALPQTVVFMLWGNQAKAKRTLVTAPQHRIVESGHPSPLSVRHFLGCRCFSTANRHLSEAGRGEIDWRVPPLSQNEKTADPAKMEKRRDSGMLPGF